MNPHRPPAPLYCYGTAALLEAIAIVAPPRVQTSLTLTATHLFGHCALEAPRRAPRRGRHRTHAPRRHLVRVSGFGIGEPIRALDPRALARVLPRDAPFTHIRQPAPDYVEVSSTEDFTHSVEVPIDSAGAERIAQWERRFSPVPCRDTIRTNVLAAHAISARTFTDTLALLRHACPTAREIVPELEGVQIDPQAGRLVFLATDRRYLATMTRGCDNAPAYRQADPIVVPVQYIRPLARITARHPDVRVAFWTLRASPDRPPHAYVITTGPESVYVPAPAFRTRYSDFERLFPCISTVRTKAHVPFARDLLSFLPSAPAPTVPGQTQPIELRVEHGLLHVAGSATGFRARGPAHIGRYCPDHLTAHVKSLGNRALTLMFTESDEALVTTSEIAGQPYRGLFSARRRI